MEMEKDGPGEKMLRMVRDAQAEEEQLAAELVRVLNGRADPSASPMLSCLESVARWERAEAIAGVLRICIALATETDPFTMHNLSRQLRRWRREEGETNRGWLEIREVNGRGPYVYFRWRNPGERKIHTEYYGRADQLLVELGTQTFFLRKEKKEAER